VASVEVSRNFFQPLFTVCETVHTHKTLLFHHANICTIFIYIYRYIIYNLISYMYFILSSFHYLFALCVSHIHWNAIIFDFCVYRKIFGTKEGETCKEKKMRSSLGHQPTWSWLWSAGHHWKDPGHVSHDLIRIKLALVVDSHLIALHRRCPFHQEAASSAQSLRSEALLLVQLTSVWSRSALFAQNMISTKIPICSVLVNVCIQTVAQAHWTPVQASRPALPSAHSVKISFC
jgi:hypothetical protein